MQPFLYNILQFLSRLSLQQKVALAALFLGSIVVLGGISYWASRPDYTLLFGGLAPTDASRIVESLTDEGVKYELKENGTAIYVPHKDVYELRLRFAGEGIVSEGPAGYELFDQGTLGMTDFMQKLNMKRALEGELARTITSVRQVEVCRVHLVIPERSPFRETQNRPSASVVLQMAGGARLSPAQIEGIGALVAGAVEGLDPSDVNVLDARGNILSNPDAGDPDLAFSSTQLRMQQAVEVQLAEKGQSMLDRMLGPGNAIVRVTAALDFSRSVSERELIDPESATVISEEKLEEPLDVDLSANSSVRNYELSRTRERSEKSVGEIADLSVSVILNYKKTLPQIEEGAAEEGGEGAEPAFEPYPEDKIREIEQLVKTAVGFQQERGDQFAIHQMLFDTSTDDSVTEAFRGQQFQQQIQIYVRYGLMLIALMLAAWLIRSSTKRLGELMPLQRSPDQLALDAGRRAPGLGQASERGRVAPGSTARQLAAAEDDDIDVELVDDIYTRKLSAEARARLKAKHLMFEEIKTQVVNRPDDTVELLRSWLASDFRPVSRAFTPVNATDQA